MADQAPPRTFNPNLHGARGLFAALVFVYHVAHSGLPTFYPAGSWLDRYALGSLKFGVELFFGISGFVIVGALARAPSPRAFAWDRMTRIYPVLWCSLVAILGFSLVTHRPGPPPGQLFLNFLAAPPFFQFWQLNPAAWSLGYEMTFYLLAALCWAMRQAGWRSWQVFGVLTGALLLILFPRAILIPAGLLIALGLGRHSLIARLSRPGVPLLVAFLLSWRWIDLATGNLRTFNPLTQPIGHWLAFLPLILLSGLLGALALADVASGRGALGRLLRLRSCQWLGTVSYSFYLWHPVVMAVVKLALRHMHVETRLGSWSQAGFAVASLPPVLLVAWASQQLIELRLTRLLRRRGPPEDRGQAPITACHIDPSTAERGAIALDGEGYR